MLSIVLRLAASGKLAVKSRYNPDGIWGGLRREVQKVAVCRKVDMAEKATPGICSTSCVMRNLYCGRLLAFQSFYSCILCAKKTVFKLKW